MSKKSELRIEMEKQGFSKHEISKAYYKHYRIRNIEKLETYNNSEVVKTRSINRHMKARYGLQRDQYDAMIVSQENRCKICGAVFGDRRTVHIDHSHASGKVRGLLCAGCNTTLGQVKDNTDILARMINYLSDTEPQYSAT